MLYISPTNEYPRHIGDIKIEHPDYKDGEPLPDGWIHVEESEYPDFVAGKAIFELEPKEIDGKYYQSFSYRDLTLDEVDAIALSLVKNKVAYGQPLTEAEATLLVG